MKIMDADLVRHSIHSGETHATLITTTPYLKLAEETIGLARREISAAIEKDPKFQASLAPIRVAEDAPAIIRRMAEAAKQFAVGPMAAVAGAIAQVTVETLVRAGATHVIFDNGGDIVLRIDRPVVVGIFTGGGKVRDLGFRLQPQDSWFSICTSSGKIGHSLSFGRADAATVIAPDGFFADAAATALGNRIRTGETGEIEAAINGMLCPEIEGMLVVVGDNLGMGGLLPEIIRTAIPIGIISHG